MSQRADILVERALREYPKTRSNDRSLMLCVWYLQNPNYQDDIKTFNSFFMNTAIMPETITRCRRKFQENYKYLGTPQVMAKRYKKFTQMRGYGSTSTEAIGETL